MPSLFWDFQFLLALNSVRRLKQGCEVDVFRSARRVIAVGGGRNVQNSGHEAANLRLLTTVSLLLALARSYASEEKQPKTSISLCGL